MKRGKTPTLAELRKLAARKGMVVYWWPGTQTVAMVARRGRASSLRIDIWHPASKDMAFEIAFAALSALPDKPKGGK